MQHKHNKQLVPFAKQLQKEMTKGAYIAKKTTRWGGLSLYPAEKSYFFICLAVFSQTISSSIDRARPASAMTKVGTKVPVAS